MNSTVYADYAEVKITPYNPAYDQLSMITNDYENRIVATFHPSGKLVIEQAGGPELTKDDWDVILNKPAYRLNLDVRMICKCCWYLKSVS